jgi:hypothetical protein
MCHESKNDPISTTKLWKTIRSLNSNEKQANKIIKLNTTSRNDSTSEKFAQSLEGTFNLNTNDFNPPIEVTNFTLPERILPDSNVTKISIQGLNKVIKSLEKEKKPCAPGNDGITYNHIINSQPNIKLLIVDVFNQSLQTSEIPTEWKLSKIIMLKKPNKPADDVGSYRPI